MSDSLFKRLMLNDGADPSALMVEAAKHIAHLEATAIKQASIIETLHTRLEDNFAWREVDGKMIKVAVEPGSIPDGIDCRNETIKLLEARIQELQKPDA